jgi:hypothetical protein
MRTYRTEMRVEGRTSDVLAVLCDPEACARWSPVPFEIKEIGSSRLQGGTRARIEGRLAGWTAEFDIEVREAGRDGLWLRTRGPVELDVRYELYEAGCDTDVRASVSVERAHGLRGRVLAHAADAIVAAGILRRAVSGIAREVEARAERCGAHTGQRAAAA